jgi:AcrR family transcriptional regulator
LSKDNKKIGSIPESRKESIVRCASELFLKKGYDGTSIRDVASASEISMGTLYHYISTKENLLRMVVDYHKERNVKIINEIESAIKTSDPEKALLSAIRILLEAIDDNKKSFVFIFTEAKLMPKQIRAVILETETTLISVFENILLDGIKEKRFQLSDPGLVAHHIVSMAEMWGIKWWYLKDRSTLEKFHQSIVNLIIPVVYGAD